MGDIFIDEHIFTVRNFFLLFNQFSGWKMDLRHNAACICFVSFCGYMDVLSYEFFFLDGTKTNADHMNSYAELTYQASLSAIETWETLHSTPAGCHTRWKIFLTLLANASLKKLQLFSRRQWRQDLLSSPSMAFLFFPLDWTRMSQILGLSPSTFEYFQIYFLSVSAFASE